MFNKKKYIVLNATTGKYYTGDSSNLWAKKENALPLSESEADDIRLAIEGVVSFQLVSIKL